MNAGTVPSARTGAADRRPCDRASPVRRSSYRWSSATRGHLETSTRNLERFLATFDCAQTVAAYEHLRRLVMWGTDDPLFDVKWAY